MLLVNSYIEISGVNDDGTVRKWKFDHCVDIEIVSDINSLTDTCKITIPRKYQWLGKDIAMGDQPYIKRKDKVLVKLGYDGKLKTQFLGYVKDIRAGVPVVIECEDTMFLLKQGHRTINFKAGMNLSEWLNDIVPHNMLRVYNDVEMGKLEVTNMSDAQILDWIKSEYGFSSYFRLIDDEPVLYVGLPYSQLIQDRKECTYRFGSNIIDANDLVYKIEEDIRIKVKVISIDSNNERKEIEVGDADGELRTVHYYRAGLALMNQRAAEDLKRFKYTGYRGSFTTFGEPSIRVGDVANIIGNQYNPDGKYLVSKVTKRLGVTTGYKQTIEPQQIVND